MGHTNTTLSFKERTENYMGGAQLNTEDYAIKQWMLDGCYDVIRRISQSTLAGEFERQSAAYTGALVVDLQTVREVTAIERNGMLARQVHSKLRRHVDPGDSIGAMSVYKATSFDPVFYSYNSNIYLKPTPTAAEPAYYSYIPEYEIEDYATVGSSITEFPSKYYEHVIIYAAMCGVSKQMLNLIESSDVATALTAATTKLTEASNLLNGDSPAASRDALDLLIEEDTELIETTLATFNATTAGAASYSTEAQNRMSVIKDKYTWYSDKLAELMTKYLSLFPQTQGALGATMGTNSTTNQKTGSA